MKKIIKKGVVVFLVFIWALSGCLIDSQNWTLFFSINMISIGLLFFIAFLDGYVY